MEIRGVTMQDLVELVRGVLSGEWELSGPTSSSFTLYRDLLDEDYISIDVFKNSKEKLEVDITFDYSMYYHHEARVFGSIDELLSYVKKVNGLSLDEVNLELDTTFSNYVHKVLR